MLGLRRKRWPNIKPLQGQHLVLAGIIILPTYHMRQTNAVFILGQRRRQWANIKANHMFSFLGIA